ncbi:MAG: FMN-binding glutamate synthase family protein, partial [Endomicrobiia bacterium]
AMVGKTIGNLIKSGKVPAEYKEYGDTIEQIFVGSAELKKRFGKDFEKIPPSAIGLYTYFSRLATGLKQFMAGARKFALKYIDRSDLVALTKEASEISGIPYVMDVDKEEALKLLNS